MSTNFAKTLVWKRGRQIVTSHTPHTKYK